MEMINRLVPKQVEPFIDNLFFDISASKTNSATKLMREWELQDECGCNYGNEMKHKGSDG